MQNSPRLIVAVQQEPRADAGLVIRANKMHGPILARLDIDEDAGHQVTLPQTGPASGAGRTRRGLGIFRWAGIGASLHIADMSQ